MILDPTDAAPADRTKVADAAARFRLEVIADDGPVFHRAWDMLDTFFGPRGELEERETLAAFVRDPRLRFADGMEGNYRIVVAWDGDEMVGVRDCYVDIDPTTGACIVALSHSFVAPACRRSGLAALFRAIPVTMARALVPPHMDVVVAAEMEPVDPEDRDSVVRLVAYGRSGFSVLDPARVPYSQPDFRDLVALGASHLAIPLMPVVRWVGHESAREMPVPLAAAYVRLFHQCHRLYLPPTRVDPSEVHAYRALLRPAGPVPVLPLPVSLVDLAPLRPLMRSAVFAHYPDVLRGPRPEIGDPPDEYRCLIETWA